MQSKHIEKPITSLSPFVIEKQIEALIGTPKSVKKDEKSNVTDTFTFKGFNTYNHIHSDCLRASGGSSVFIILHAHNAKLNSIPISKLLLFLWHLRKKLLYVLFISHLPLLKDRNTSIPYFNNFPLLFVRRL